MTNSLITVFNGLIQNTSVQLANARDLHLFLEIKSGFDNWIKNRITDYSFIQDEDYIIVTERTNGRPRKEYHITLDMGKELAMVERNEKGRQIRKYFIECERKANSQNEQQIAPLTITPEQQRAIQEAVQQAHYRTGLHWQEIYSRLKSTFNVAKYDQLPQTMFEHVINFLNTLGNQYRPIDRSKKDITIAGLDAEQIAKYLVRARAFAKEVEVFHRKLYKDLGIPRYVKNDIAGKAYDITHEFNVWLDPFIEQALPQLNQQRLARF
ncbi:antA/AntB antirepressor family protein [Glaesserella parasuis]|uniref:antA/AntB antirepressor family protein n=1 Tax=Glaesserella parasuis TaxID=738 RepID=UPI001F3E0910|nr:antA/AntB antirepressor family protein [Glaesserella parasuis]